MAIFPEFGMGAHDFACHHWTWALHLKHPESVEAERSIRLPGFTPDQVTFQFAETGAGRRSSSSGSGGLYLTS
jgi:hypothetical protein